MRLMAGSHITLTTYPTRPRLHSWPGDTPFDDLDSEDFDDDVPEPDCLRMGTFARYIVQVHD
jgi:hypothetical protein